MDQMFMYPWVLGKIRRLPSFLLQLMEIWRWSNFCTNMEHSLNNKVPHIVCIFHFLIFLSSFSMSYYFVFVADKLKKTPLIHAVLNGHAHVVSYLLSEGANPNAVDSSGNTCLHYAAAYGWYFCLKLLLHVGANPNVSNDWKVNVHRYFLFQIIIFVKL